ncbi:MAG TPA: SLBB domain-containing protein, partial [Candidatus Acidoferrales bacterium]|nr:SLBB domain-containing protein [Candidatus Acidoferrales bacterium]
STPLNALFLAGGPTERGSLRVAQHFRGKQLVEEVDLYALLLHGVKSGLARLEDGDSILVPPIGSAVTVEGMVRRPAVYELRGEKNLAEVLELAGGILPSAALDHIEVERLEDHRKRTMVSLSVGPNEDADGVRRQLESFAVRDQDIIHLFPIAAYNQKAVYLEGHVLRPGRYAYREGMKLTDLLAGYSDLMPEPAGQYAEIIHLAEPDYAPSVEGFNLDEALSGRTSAPVLKPMDTIRIFGKYDFESVPTVSVWGEVREPGSYRVSGEIRVRDAVHFAGGTTPDALMDSAQIFRSLPDSTLKVLSVDLEKALDGDWGANVRLEPRDRLVVHRNPAKVDPPSVYVQGEISKPGRYPLTQGMRISDLVQVGGGLRRSADSEIASLTQFRVADAEKVVADERAVNLKAALGKDPATDFPLRDGDTLTIREISGWSDRGASITVRGEVQHPGTFGIRPGERLSSILARAGGFGAAAYPHGAVLERLDVRAEEERSQRTLVVRVQEEQQALNQLPENDNTQKAAKAAAMAQWQRILDSLVNNPPVGRLVIHINANVRSWQNTAEDVPVRAGDVLVVPKTPNFVLVTGQVYNPTAIAYRPGKSAGWYLRQGGGPTHIADQKAIFVIRADGGVANSEAMASLWKGSPLGSTLEPGDTVVVPEKAVGRSISWQSVFLAGQVASSVATSVLVAVHY